MTTNRAQAKIDEDLGKPVDEWYGPRRALTLAMSSYIQALSHYQRTQPTGLELAHAKDAFARSERGLLRMLTELLEESHAS